MQLSYGLNPYYSGTYTLTMLKKHLDGTMTGLNPYYSGTYTLTEFEGWKEDDFFGLNPYYSGTYTLTRRYVQERNLARLS